MRSVLPLFAVFALPSCATLEIERTSRAAPGWFGANAEALRTIVEKGGSCQPSTRVIVTSASGVPIQGAEVIAEESTREYASGTFLGTHHYRVRAQTDELGVAKICAPEKLAPSSEWDGIGGGVALETGAVVIVKLGDLVVETQPPFSEFIVVRLPP
jgi:hypothetical protein